MLIFVDIRQYCDTMFYGNFGEWEAEMGSYFSVDSAFWTDPDIVDNFTPEDKYFYLYLLTSVHANISGCYELSIKQAAYELGYSMDTVEHLIQRFISVHQMIDYDKDTKEVLIHKWGKYHWTTSEKYLSALQKKIDSIKSEKFRTYCSAVLSEFFINGTDTVWIPYIYGTDTSFLYLNNISSSNPIDREKGVKGKERKVEEDPFKALAGDDKELADALNEYCKMRAKKKRVLTDRAKKIFVTALMKLPREDWVKAIDQSILHSWDSVYALKEDGHVGNNRKNQSTRDWENLKPDVGDESEYGFR